MLLNYLKNTNIYILLLSLIAFTIPMPMLVNNIAIISLILYWLLSCFRRQIKLPRLKDILVLTIPFTLLIIGSFYTSNMHQLNIEITKNLPFLILPIILYTTPRQISTSDYKTILKSFVLGNIIVSVVLFLIICKTIYTKSFTIQTLWGLTHQGLGEQVNLNAIYLSLFIGLSLSMVVNFYLEKRGKISINTKIISLASTLLFVFILIFLSSRTVLFSTMVISFILCFRYYSKRHSVFKLTIIFLLLTGVTIFIIFTINPILKWRTESLFEIQDVSQIEGKEEGIKMRKKLWSSSIEVFKNNWLIGVGAGDFKDELEKVYKKNHYRIQYRMHMNSHNQYISYLVSHGIIGLFLFLTYLFYPLILFYRKKRLFFLLTMLFFMMCLTTESYFYTNKGVILMAFFITLMVKYSTDIDNKLLRVDHG